MPFKLRVTKKGPFPIEIDLIAVIRSDLRLTFNNRIRGSSTFSTAIVLTNSYFNLKILPYFLLPNRKLSNQYNHFSVRVFEE